MSLLLLPSELLHEIAGHVTSLQTLGALARVNRHFYELFDPLLYQRDAECPRLSAIEWAVTLGKIGIIEKSFRHGAEVLCYAHDYGLFQAETRMIDGNESQHYFRSRPPHPLCLAVQNGHVDIAELFIARGCDMNMRNDERLSLLCLAVTHGHMRMLKKLLSLGARQDYTTISIRDCPIKIAAFRGDEAMIEVLLHYGSDWTRPTAKQMQGAFQCAAHEGHRHVMKTLLNSNINLNFRFVGRVMRRFETPLLWAIKQDVDLVKLCLDRGADPNVDTPLRDPALVRAVATGNEEMVRVLVGGTDRRRRTQALARSVNFPDGRMAQILLDNGTVTDFKPEDSDDASSEDFDGCSWNVEDTLIPPLIRAVLLGHSGLVRLLVTRGADVNVKYGRYIKELSEWSRGGPLLLAIKLGNEEIANFLRSQGGEEDVYPDPDGELARLEKRRLYKAAGLPLP